MVAFERAPLTLKVTMDPRNPSNLMLTGPTFVVSDVTDDNLGAMVAPLIGFSAPLRVHIRTGTNGIYLLPKNNPTRKRVQQRDQRLHKQLTTALQIDGHGIAFADPDYVPFLNCYDNINALIKEPQAEVFNVGNIQAEKVFICGAGPSLADNKDAVIAALEDPDVFVLACGTAMRVFFNWGLTPDACVAIDPFETEWRLVVDQIDPEWFRGQTLITSMSFEPRCFSHCNKRCGKMLINGGNDNLEILSYLDGLDCQHMGLSCVTFALSLALNKWDAKHINLAGVDLSFGESTGYADAGDFPDVDDRVEHEGHATRQAWINEAMYIGLMIGKHRIKVTRMGVGLPIEGVKPFHTWGEGSWGVRPGVAAYDITDGLADRAYHAMTEADKELTLEAEMHLDERKDSWIFINLLRKYYQYEMGKFYRGEKFVPFVMTKVLETHRDLITGLLVTLETQGRE